MINIILIFILEASKVYHILNKKTSNFMLDHLIVFEWVVLFYLKVNKEKTKRGE